MDIRHYASYLSHDSCPVGAALELDEIRQILRDNIMVLVSVFHVSCYNWHRAKMLRIFMVSIFSSHILISDYQFPYHWKMISLLSKLILFRLLSS